MNDELIEESVSDYGYFDRLRNSVGYGPTRSVTFDWTRGAALSKANESMAKDDYLSNSLLFFPFNADARTTYMIDMNIGLLKADQDRMAAANQDATRAQSLLDQIEELKKSTNDEAIAELLKTTDAYTGLLRDGKFDSDDVTENLNKLQSIVDEANEEYKDAYEEQMTDLQDIEDWNNSHTVSSYYTRKSKQESKLGNWFYTMPSTLGLSLSSWKEQAMSLAAGVGTSMVANAMIGGTMGSAVGPLGTAAGTGTGALVGAAIGIGSAIMSQVVGGAAAREQESHMEAFDAYQNNLLNRLAESGIDIHDAATSLREQAKALDYPNLDALSDEDIVSMAAADTRFKYDFANGLDFARAMDEAYIGTRRVYERNNALGAAEFATDVFMFTPMKPLSAVGKGLFSPLTNAARKYNPITYLQDLTMKTNLDISKLAGKMRFRALRHYGGGLLKRQGLNFIEESTEEGAQDIILKQYAAGEYADEQASDGLIDAIFNGNIISDMTDNLLFRTESGLSWLGLSSQYQNDVQQQEQMWSGGLMALLSPQGAVMTAKNFADTYKGVEQAYGAGKYIQEALQKNADIGAIEAFYRNMRKYDITNEASYKAVLDMMRDELKSAKTSKDGHTTRRWKFDTDAIHKILGPVNPNIKDSEGNPVRTNSELTDADIDEFIDGQERMASTLFRNKPSLDRAWKRIKDDFSGTVPRGKHTVEELNKLTKDIDVLEDQINSGTLGRALLAQSKKQLDKLKRQYKSYSKNAVDTDMQDAYYALSIISMYDRNSALKNRDALNARMQLTKNNLHSSIDYTKLRNAMGIKSDVDNTLLFDILWSNQNIRTLKLNRAKFEADFLAAQRAAMNGNSPIELSIGQRRALEDIDELIRIEEDMRDWYKEQIDALQGSAKTEMTNLFNFGLKSAAQFSADERTDTYKNTLNIAFDNSDSSPEDIVNYIMTRDETIGARMNALRAESNLDTLRNGEPSEIKALIEQYRKARNESFQSQQAAENEQNTGKPAELKKFSSIKDWLIEATTEQIGERIDEVDANLTKVIDLFDDFVNALPDDSPLSESLNKALNFANAIQNAANGSKVSKVRALQYQLQDLRRQFEGSTDPQVLEVNEMLNNMLQTIIDMNILNDEAKARQTEYRIPGKFISKNQNPLKIDNRTFVDNDGNFFNVDLSNSVYSENNGLVLRLIQINGNKERDKKELKASIARLESILKDYLTQANGLKTQLAAIPRKDIKDKLNAVNRQIDLTKKALEETKKALDNIDVERKLDVKYGDPLLDELHYTNNDGSTMTMNESYALTNEIVIEQGKAERSRRLSNPGVSPVNYQNVREITASQVRKEIGDAEAENEESEIKRAIAYSLMDGNNQKATSILSSPYYQSRKWSGFFYYIMDDGEVDNWKTVSDDRKNAAKRSIKLFNKLVKQSAYLIKVINRPDILKKFLDDLDAMLLVPVPNQSLNDTVTLESADPAKPEYAVTITRRELIEIIRFLPMKAKLLHPDYLSREKKRMSVPLVLADIKDESNAYDKDGKLSTKFQWRYGMVKAFLQLAHLRKKENETPTNEQELRDFDDVNAIFDKNTGFDPTNEIASQNKRKEKPYASTIHITQGDIDITFEKYNQKFDSPQFNPESPVFYDPDGKRLAKLPDSNVLNQKELISMYTDRVRDWMSSVSDSIYSEFVDLFKTLNIPVTVELLKENYPDSELTVLEKIILEGVLYGDGVILRDSFAKDTVSNTKIFGKISYESTASVQQSIEKNNRIDMLFEFIQDRFADLFLSHKNPNLLRGNQQKVTSENIRDYIANGAFNKVGDRNGRQPGSVRVLIRNSNGEYEALSALHDPAKIANLFNKLDELIDAVNNPQQFFDEILGKGIKFEFTPNPTIKLDKELREAAAINLISRYIRNRQFGRLGNVSSFTAMLISGTDHPGNPPVANQRFFAMKGQVINSNLDKIDCLHIKEVDGVYYFDLADIASKSVRVQNVDDEGNTTSVITDADAEKLLITQTKDRLTQEVEGLVREYMAGTKTLDDIVLYFNTNWDTYSAYKSFASLYDDLHNFDLKALNIDASSNKAEVEYNILFQFEDVKKELNRMIENVDEKLAETLKDQAPAEERLTFTENGKHARVQFAIGSYNERTGNARILRGDESGALVSMNEAVGQPGGVYLIIPSFMNASGKRRIVHLNGRKLGIHQANLIARILDAVRTGKVSYNGDIPSDLIPGYTIKTQATVSQLLESLINIGTKAIENDSSARAFANLLFVDNNNQVHFGAKALDDDNLSELIQFLQDTKQIRVDRDKLLNERASVGLDVDIQLTDDSEFIKGGIVKDKSVFKLEADENYQHYVISKGVIRSDLNPDTARMYTNVICSIKTPFTGNDAIPNPSNPKASNSAASARNAAATTFVSTSQFKNMVNQPLGAQQQTQQTQQTQLPATERFPKKTFVGTMLAFIEQKFGHSKFTIYRTNQKGEIIPLANLDNISQFEQNFLDKMYVTPKNDGTWYNGFVVSLKADDGTGEIMTDVLIPFNDPHVGIPLQQASVQQPAQQQALQGIAPAVSTTVQPATQQLAVYTPSSSGIPASASGFSQTPATATPLSVAPAAASLVVSTATVLPAATTTVSGYSPTKLTNNANITNADALNRVLVEKDGHNIFQMDSDARAFVLANINGVIIPFYMSSRGTDGKIKGKWYPFFGMTGTWLVKGGINKDGSMSYGSAIDTVTKLLNDNLHLDSTKDIHEMGVDGLKPYSFYDRFIPTTDSHGKTYYTLGFETMDGSRNGKRYDALYVEELTGIDASKVVNEYTAPEGFVTGIDFINQILNRISGNTATTASAASTTPSAPAVSGFSQTTSAPIVAPQATTQAASQPASSFTADMLLLKIALDLKDDSKFNSALSNTNLADARSALLSMIIRQAQTKYNAPADMIFEIDNMITGYRGDLGDLLTKLMSNLPFYGVAAEFLDKYVEREDYESAQKRAIKILGDPEIRFTSELPFTYDSNRKAFVYVFGQCAESFMRIYRSANGEVAQGVIDHEAFHRISLFVLSEKERKRMYDDVRKAYPETQNMTNQQVEEFAADLFRDFVAEYSKQGVDGFYSKNGFVKFFQKLYDLGAKIMRKLFGIRTNPNYRGLQKLFEDMYSGRYAYARATKDNIQLFSMLYRTAPMDGVKTNKGVIVASNVSQYNQILRTLLDHVVNDSKLLDTVHNYTDIDSVMDSIKAKLTNDYSGLSDRAKQAYVEGHIDDVVRWLNLTKVYNNILPDEKWDAWKKIINDTLRRQFKISNQRRDPNQLLDVMEDGEVEYQIESYEDDTEETTESEGIEDPVENDSSGLNLGFDQERDSLQRNMWNSAALSVKIMFYTVTSEDSRHNKYDSNGLLNYGDPIQLYIKFTDLLLNCMSEEEMMHTLTEAQNDPEVASVLQHLTLDSDPEVNKSLQNKFFTSVCRYQHNFENNVYEIERNSDDEIVSVDARSVSGNMNEVTTKTRAVIQRSIVDALATRGAEISDDTWKNNYTKYQDELNAATNALSDKITKKDILREVLLKILRLLYKYNGFGMFVEGDYNFSQSVDMLVSFLYDSNSEQVNKAQVANFKDVLNIITNSITRITPSSINKENEGQLVSKSESINYKLQKIINENVTLLVFFKNIGRNAPRQVKTMSQNGPKNVRIYTIGAFNYISRLFKLWTKPHIKNGKLAHTDWREYLERNPYAEHSLWFKNKEALANAKMSTRLQTMNDGDFASAKNDKFALDKEEYINRMVTVLQMDDSGKWLGGHAFPVLANKKFSADLPGLVISQLEQPVRMDATPTGTKIVINKGAQTVFANYFLDELAAIRQAKQTRDNFIKAINDALGTNYTVKSFSELGVSEQRDVLSAKNLPEEQRLAAIAKINDALRTLTVTYHFKSSKTEPVRDSYGRIVSYNDAHIDLTKGAGYAHRHFQQIANKLAENKNIDMETLTADNGILLGLVSEMLNKQISINIGEMAPKIYSYIPENMISQFKKKYKGLNDDQIKEVMMATFVVRHMSDMLEYEKLVQGDMAYYGDGSTSKKYKSTIDKMTKRYAGPVSTFGLNASSGTKPMSLTIDDGLNLTNESTYNTITIQTTKLIDYDVYEGLIKKALGIDVVINYGEDTVDPQIDYKQLLDENGKIKKLVLSGVFAPYKYFLNTFDDKTVAIAIVKDVLNRYEGYLSQDYTDASTFISPSMFRELRQRSDDGWTETEEACWIFMEHYDQLYDIQQMAGEDWQTIVNAAHTLGIDDDTLESLVSECRNLYNRQRETRGSEYWNLPEFRRQRARYRGRILSFLEDENGNPKIDTTAMKYIHYGNRPQEGEQALYIPVFDKTALEPLFKIFTEDHEAEHMYNLMHDRNIHVMKYDSSTKSGGIFGYQLYDEQGNFNQDLYNAPTTKQWFAQLSKQLDTDMHIHNDTNLLTQITKVIMLNSIQHDYNFGGEQVSGSEINQLYSSVFNSLTKEGFRKFRESFGFDENGNLDAEGKQKLVSKLREILEQSGASQAIIDAFELDLNGDFIVNPALLPSMNQIQSRLLSQIGKIIVDTHMKGLPMYQIVSVGFDQDHPLKKGVSFDPLLLSPGDIDEHGNVVTRMQARVSIMLFNDVINKAKKNAKLNTKYHGFVNFEDKRRFILDNKDQLCSIAYRVPTQGQNSTMAIDIVDVLPSTQGGIIQLPTTLTALTGADFDIDKLFTATYNYEVTDKGIRRVSYNDKYKTIGDLIAHMSELSVEQKENLLLDIYQTILTSKENLLHTSTPLDVCTAPIKNVMLNEIPDLGQPNNNDGFSLTPMHQVQMRVLNSGSDSTIGPMALNSVFQYFTQSCDLGFIDDPQLKKLGLKAPGMEYIQSLENNEDGQQIMRIAYILDTTSAMINAAVDAAKDNYIGRSNINAETFDVVNLLIACGFGNNAFRFLAQPGVIAYVNGKLNASKEAIFREKAESEPIELVDVHPEMFTTEYLRKHLKDDIGEIGNPIQREYVHVYAYLKSVALRYRQAITVAQVDTKKYGKNPTELMSFLQNVDDFTSVYNLIFSTPNNLFEQSFLKEKLNAVRTATDMFGNIFMENSPLFKLAAELMCTIFNKRGSYSKKFLSRAMPKLKQAVLKGFFDSYILRRFPSPDGTPNLSPLYDLFSDSKKSVIARYDKIHELCIKEGIGFDFFDMIKHSPIREDSKKPKFFIVDNRVNGNAIAKQKITDSIVELFHSEYPEVRQWITDVAVMLFYQTGGTDTSFGTAVRSSFYDMLPIRELSNIEARQNDGSVITLNDYIANNPYTNDVNGLVNQAVLQLSISDDEYVKLFKAYRKDYGIKLSGDGSVAMLLKYSTQARTDRRGARYAKYIKILENRTSTPALYVLGNVIRMEKDDKVYYNPIYFRVSRLGYQQYNNRSNSIRVDGVYYNGVLTSLFNVQTRATVTDNKQVAFTARNLEELRNGIRLNSGVSVKYKAIDEINNHLEYQKTKKGFAISELNVDELGNVDFDDYSDPYFGMFDLVNPKSTNVVLCRFSHAPNDLNQDFVQRAKELGTKFQQLVRTEDGDYEFIGTNEALSGQVSLLTNTWMELNESINAIFDKYPNVTLIKFIDGMYQVRVVTRLNRENIGESLNINNNNLITLNKYSRQRAEQDSESLYIFTDNTDRTSGGEAPANTWYTDTYGDIADPTGNYPVGGYGSNGNPTTAVVRGLPNAAPISTMKWFYKKHGLNNVNSARWTDKDYDEVRTIVEQELENIRELLRSGKFKRIVIPNNDFLLDSGIAQITQDRTPRLYEYFKDVQNRIKDMVSPDSEFATLLSNIELNKDSEEQRNKKC